METVKETLGLRAFITVCFSLIFMFQAYTSFNKYLEYPVVYQMSKISIDNIEHPWFYICPTHRYHYQDSKENGYHLIADVMLGNLTGSKIPSWKGLKGDLSFWKLAEMLFTNDFTGVEISKSTEKVFLFHHGFCLKTSTPDMWLSTNEASLTIFNVHPSSDLAITFNKSPGNRIQLDVGKDYSYQFHKYEISYEVHDQTIHEGYSCVDYRKQTESYGDCILRNFKEYALSVFGCYPPWFDDITGKVCEEDIEANEIKNGTYDNIHEDFFSLIDGSNIDAMAKCIQPCYIVETKLTEKNKINNYTEYSQIHINTKGKEASLRKDAYSFDIFALVVELGSALGLWLGKIFIEK